MTLRYCFSFKIWNVCNFFMRTDGGVYQKILHAVTFGRSSANLESFVIELVIYFRFHTMIGSLKAYIWIKSRWLLIRILVLTNSYRNMIMRWQHMTSRYCFSFKICNFCNFFMRRDGGVYQKILPSVTFGRTSANLKSFVIELVIYFRFHRMIGSLKAYIWIKSRWLLIRILVLTNSYRNMIMRWQHMTSRYCFSFNDANIFYSCFCISAKSLLRQRYFYLQNV